MSDAPQSAGTGGPAEGARQAMPEHVRYDMPCVQCGYNVRSMPVAGKCPECATSIAKSVEGFSMQTAPPAFVRALRRGMLVTGWGAIALAACTIASVFVGALLGFMPRINPLAVTVALSGVVTMITIVMMAGVWKLTTPERVDRPFAPLHTPRLLARGAAVVVVLLALWAMVAQLFVQQGMQNVATVMRAFRGQATQAQAGGGPPWQAINMLLQNLPWASIVQLVVSTVLLTIAWCIAVCACMVYCRWLGRRMRDAKLVKLCSVVVWLSVGASGLFGCIGIAPFLLQILLAVVCWRFARALRPLVGVHAGA